jgi:hypothetical protein
MVMLPENIDEVQIRDLYYHDRQVNTINRDGIIFKKDYINKKNTNQKQNV